MSTPPVTAAQKSVGRIVFPPGTTEQMYLLFIPSVNPRSLKILKDSMWFAVENSIYGDCYRAAASIEAIQWLRDTLGPLKLERAVHDWMEHKSRILPLPEIPGLPLFDFQLDGAGFLSDRDRAMLSLSPGLGKTITSIAAANVRFDIKKILVVAPVSLLYMWKAEIEKWSKNLTRPFAIHIAHKTINGREIDKLDELPTMVWVIANPETVTSQTEAFAKRKFDLMILDESILYKNRNAKRTRAVNTLAKKIRVVWELTGAPANRMLDDLWSQFHILNPKAYSSYWRFSDTYCMTSNNGWGNQVMANKLGSEKVIQNRFRDIYFARAQEDVLDLPPLLFENIDVPMTAYQEKIYDDLATDLYAIIHNEETDDSRRIAITNHLEKVIRLIQAASNPMLIDGNNSSGKLDILPDLLDYYPKPFVFWTSFIRSNLNLLGLLDKWGLRAGNMLGETLPEDRQKVVQKFQDGKLDAIVVGTAVGSFGHTLTAARTAFYLERTFDGNYFQSLKRIHRIGTTQSPVVIGLRSVYRNNKKTIDHLVDSLLDYRLEMIKELTTGMLRDIL